MRFFLLLLYYSIPFHLSYWQVRHLLPLVMSVIHLFLVKAGQVLKTVFIYLSIYFIYLFFLGREGGRNGDWLDLFT